MSQNRSTAVMQRRVEAHDSLDERWVPVAGWDGYDVSDQGRVRSWKQRSRKERRQWEIDYNQPARVLRACVRNGYPSVLLIKHGSVRAWFSVHRLVLAAFVRPAMPREQGAHADDNRSNNALANLRWATPAENNADKISHGTHQWGQRIGTAKLTDLQVAEIRAARLSGSGVKHLAQQYGVCCNTITNITTGKSWIPPCRKRLERAGDYEVAP